VGPRVTIRPWREGGTGGDSKSEIQPEEMPYVLEGGTPNALGIAGLAAGIEWVVEKGPDANRLHEVELLQKVVDWVDAQGQADGWKIAGHWEPQTHVGALSLVTPNLDDLHPQTLADMLDTSF